MNSEEVSRIKFICFGSNESEKDICVLSILDILTEDDKTKSHYKLAKAFMEHLGFKEITVISEEDEMFGNFDIDWEESNVNYLHCIRDAKEVNTSVISPSIH